MAGSVLEDAFSHHVWATLRVIDTCAMLSTDQLETAAPGTFGSIIATLRHLVAADSSYLFTLTNALDPNTDAAEPSVADLREQMERNGDAWAALLSGDLDPDAVVVRHREDGSQSHAPVGIRLAQALHHGTDHRSQVCTVLTTIGVEPPAIDVWDFAELQGRLSETPPTT
jgi:uncharacterized damage-inducible protein DinB